MPPETGRGPAALRERALFGHGIILTAWPELIAEWLPNWLRFRVALAIVLEWPALRFWWLWTRSRQDKVLV
jgi:hypothetical protein